MSNSKSLLRSGDPFIWLTGGALSICLIMVAGLVLLILLKGFGYFWPASVETVKLASGKVMMGVKVDRHEKAGPAGKAGTEIPELKYNLCNRDNEFNQGGDFVWVNESEIVSTTQSKTATVIERLEYGNFIGYVKEVRDDEKVVASGDDESVAAIKRLMPEVYKIQDQVLKIEKDEFGALSYKQNAIRLQIRKWLLHPANENAAALFGPRFDDFIKAVRETKELDKLEQDETLKTLVPALNALWKQAFNGNGSALQPKLDEFVQTQREFRKWEVEREKLTTQLSYKILLKDVNAKEKWLSLGQVVRIYQPNEMTTTEKVGFYLSKLWAFLSSDPRESNTEGGVFPAILGTVMMVFIMSLMVTPLGVIAALYLREYAKQGTFVSIVRVAVNNLAGVPSIVFGVFGVGFFILTVGTHIDKTFFPEALPTPTFGTGGILWASLTLALLTLPVVIVATEEGLAAIPPSVRDASMALGATKFETTWRVVIPAVMPSILTGLILAMARAAGEVAPLMITGVVKLAPALPLDGQFPYFHPDRKFMHLGFHLYDVGFQSPNVDAARPMVFVTSLLLLVIVLLLNIGAIVVRNRLRKKFASSGV